MIDLRNSVTLVAGPDRNSNHPGAVCGWTFAGDREPGKILGRACSSYVLLPFVVGTCGSLLDVRTTCSTPHPQSLEEGVEVPF